MVSRLGFGAMTFGQGQGMFAAVSKVGAEMADQMVGKAMDAGVNHFNTANGYTGGQSEQFLGKALGAKRKEVVISTKCGFRNMGVDQAVIQSGLSRQHILASCDASLKRLGTDYIDVYLVHRVDVHTPIEETVAALDQLVRDGKVRYIGFSNWPAWMAAKAIGIQKRHGLAQFRAAELYYSLTGRDVEHDLVPFLHDAGIGMFVWSPLAGGLLTGKYTKDNPKGDGGRLADFDFLPDRRESGYRVAQELNKIGKAHSVSAAQVALAWLLTKPVVSSILVGANKLPQLEDNLGAAKLKLDLEELAGLEELTTPEMIYPNWFTARVADPVVTLALKEDE